MASLIHIYLVPSFLPYSDNLPIVFFYYPTEEEECPSPTLDDGHLFDVTVVEREKRGKGNLAMT
jgi:hypothetical protein